MAAAGKEGKAAGIAGADEEGEDDDDDGTGSSSSGSSTGSADEGRDGGLDDNNEDDEEEARDRPHLPSSKGQSRGQIENKHVSEDLMRRGEPRANEG